MADEEIESTLFIAREVSLYRVPPRRAEGYRSGTWMVGDKIFTGRLRMMARGSLMEIRVEDPNRCEARPDGSFPAVGKPSGGHGESSGLWCASYF
jgi:Protein of unknown function (DUF1681)